MEFEFHALTDRANPGLVSPNLENVKMRGPTPSGVAGEGDALTIALGIQQITGSSLGSVAVYDALNDYEN